MKILASPADLKVLVTFARQRGFFGIKESRGTAGLAGSFDLFHDSSKGGIVKGKHLVGGSLVNRSNFPPLSPPRLFTGHQGDWEKEADGVSCSGSLSLSFSH